MSEPGTLTFFEVVKRYMERAGVQRIDRVISVDQELSWGGYCETCAFNDTEVVITYPSDEWTSWRVCRNCAYRPRSGGDG
jgi:hypothetical protein